MDRKLAAILSADVAGYSRLTALDEEGTLSTLAGYRDTIFEFVAEHGGRVFGTAGDSVVAEFGSAVQSVRCAVAIQRSLFRHNRDLPENRRIEFRIGINLGDVVISGDDLLGDGINVAARLQEIAQPGGICITGSIREHIDGKLNFRLINIGERKLKNIPRPVSVLRVDWQAEDPTETGVLSGELSLPDKPSIAVLPFDNMSGDPEQEYFADGITEDIITALSRHRWFFVIARNSSFTYKGKAVDVKVVARELGVRYVLEGSVRKAGRRLRITGQLIDAETGAHLWAERYDRDSEDIFDIQDEITESVTGAIEPEILMGEGRRAVSGVKADPDAFDCCMRSVWHHYQSTREHYEEAQKWARRAINHDPTYPRAHMTLARLHFGNCVFAWSPDVAADTAEVVRHAEKSVNLDQRDPYCHYAMFTANMLRGKLPSALASAQRAIDLNPNFALGHLALGWARNYSGLFEEALEPLLRALRLSPHDPLAFLFLSQIGLTHIHLGNYEEALHFGERALSARRMHAALMVTIARLGMLDRAGEAEPLVAEAAELAPADPVGYWKCVHPYADPAHRATLADGLRRGGLPMPDLD